MINYYKFLCEKLHINFKKDLIMTISIFTILSIISVVFYFIYSPISAILLFLINIGYVSIHFSNLKSLVKQLVYSKEIAFNSLYRYVLTLLKNGHVLYAALQASLEYVDEVLIDDVNELITSIENDTSIEPFFKFMENFEDETIKQMVLLLYKTQEVGVINNVIASIDECMINLQDTSIKNYVYKEEKKVGKYYLMPIVLSAIVMIIISFYVFTLIGEGLYV